MPADADKAVTFTEETGEPVCSLDEVATVACEFELLASVRKYFGLSAVEWIQAAEADGSIKWVYSVATSDPAVVAVDIGDFDDGDAIFYYDVVGPGTAVLSVTAHLNGVQATPLTRTVLRVVVTEQA